MESWLCEARKASELSYEDCASALGCSRNTFVSRENNPGTLSINELVALYGIFNRGSRAILWQALQEFQV